jgi:hypothetical protein
VQVGQAADLPAEAARQRPSAVDLAATFTFSGRVYEGAPYDQTHPLKDVTVKLYGSNNPAYQGAYGTQLASTTTSDQGWWALTIPERQMVWEYYHLVETDPPTYTSIAATSVGGTVVNSNCIAYIVPLAGKEPTGNKFWDQVRYTATATRTATPRTTATASKTPTSRYTATATPRVSATPSVTPRVSPTPSPTPSKPATGGITFPQGDWPWYAQGEITVHPEPPVAGNLTRLCAQVVNTDASAAHSATLAFRVANFGIGLAFAPVGQTQVTVPPNGVAEGCVIWTPPAPGHWCIEVLILQPGAEPQRSQRNIDLDEPLVPGVPHERVIPIGNPLDRVATITLGLVPHLPDWGFSLSQDVLPNMAPGEVRHVILTVTPPQDRPLPPDGHPIVDVEAYIDGELIGGIRKVFRPAVPLHRFPDPFYAEREISVSPYPPRAGEPTELCVELRNPTDAPQTVNVQFSWAHFGIGMPWWPIDGWRPVHLPPHSVVKQCLYWVPPVGGQVCIQVTIELPGYPPQRSQRNLDVSEVLQPGVPNTLLFPVTNPFQQPMTITLGLVPHLPDWGLELSQDVLPDMAPGEVRFVGLTVTPPLGRPLPEDGTPIVDVEAWAGGELIGGFRKAYRPPVPIHRPKDPVYAESEIGIDPYPAIPGQPTVLSVEVRNQTPHDQYVAATFAVASFGIGLPFGTADIQPNPVLIFVPANGAARGQVVWTPPNRRGRFCVQVSLAIEGYPPVFSQRNIDVGEPLRPGVPHELAFAVGSGEHQQPVTVTLGLVLHRPGWEVALGTRLIPNVQPGETITTTLTVVPPPDAVLGTGEPIVDVEAYVDGELLGGFRKLDVPPVPLHKPHEKGYAESEIRVQPYPPRLGQTSKVSTVLQNASEVPVTVQLEFGWANFGLGIPFGSDGMSPPSRTVTVGAGMTTTAQVDWTPIISGHQCILVRMSDTLGLYQPQVSQRNVDVAELPPCNTTKVFTFTVHNDSPFTATVDIGMVTFNVPANWQVTTSPNGPAPIPPFGDLTVVVTVHIPCPGTALASLEEAAIRRMQRLAGGVPTIDVEGYSNGELLGGIEIQFPDQGAEGEMQLNLPLIMRNR